MRSAVVAQLVGTYVRISSRLDWGGRERYTRTKTHAHTGVATERHSGTEKHRGRDRCREAKQEIARKRQRGSESLIQSITGVSRGSESATAEGISAYQIHAARSDARDGRLRSKHFLECRMHVLSHGINNFSTLSSAEIQVPSCRARRSEGRDTAREWCREDG